MNKTLNLLDLDLYAENNFTTEEELDLILSSNIDMVFEKNENKDLYDELSKEYGNLFTDDELEMF